MAVTVFEDYAGQARNVVSEVARASTFDEIPIIDLAPFLKLEATEDEKLKVVSEVRDACQNVGFLYVKGHGLCQDSMNKAFEESKRFFELSADDKMKTYFRLSPDFRGYEPSKGETHQAGDIKEAFNFGYEPEADFLNPSNDFEEYLASTPSGGRNVWPEDLPELKTSLYTYYGQVLKLGRQMIRIFALALELPEDYFDDAFKVPGALGRTLYYPSQPPDVEDRTIGIRAHTDIECFTFLLQGANVSCLQVLNKVGEWVEAPPIPGTLVMNIGALPGCVPSGEKPTFPTILAGEYVYRRLARSRLGIAYEETVSLDDLAALGATAATR